ncbi:hypothetical protein FA15DRAFT_671784 [Coprinopsis marcescibilis]|uniref:Uncharacterized protein n=1 Tax=Coprinopsis marcescibilis TaxID=230819 RepID=A0A5C3KR05_COPMA|nr:hypothetical protein FA15DRAFT_671784 [Coprinopsis marcescibilis]
MALLIASTAMSHSQRAFSSSTRIADNRFSTPDFVARPIQYQSDYHNTRNMYSSSPARSSSPPGTPYAPRHTHHNPYIQSSPAPSTALHLQNPRYTSLDPPSYWPQASSDSSSSKNPIPNPKTHQQQHQRLPPSKYPPTFYDEPDFPPSSSEFEIDDVVEDAEMSLPEMDSETTSESTPGHGSVYFSDSESGEDDDADGGLGAMGMGVGYGHGGVRTTFFRVSAERGRWKDDPLALKPAAMVVPSYGSHNLRNSLPAPSRLRSDGGDVVGRPISEPLVDVCPAFAFASVDSGEGGSVVPGDERAASAARDEEDAVDEEGGDGEDDERNLRELSVAHSLRAETPECDGRGMGSEVYSSPLPPSSPPVSPMLGCVFSLSRSVSPLSIAPSSPRAFVDRESSPGLELDVDADVDADVGLGLGLQERDDEAVDGLVVVESGVMREEAEEVVDECARAEGSNEPAVLDNQELDVVDGIKVEVERDLSGDGGELEEVTGDVEQVVDVQEECPTDVPAAISLAEIVSGSTSTAVAARTTTTVPTPPTAPTPRQRSASPDENVAPAKPPKRKVQAKDASRALMLQDDNGAVLPDEMEGGDGRKRTSLKRKLRLAGEEEGDGQSHVDGDSEGQSQNRKRPAKKRRAGSEIVVSARKRRVEDGRMGVDVDVDMDVEDELDADMGGDEIGRAGPSKLEATAPARTDMKSRKKEGGSGKRSQVLSFPHESPHKVKVHPQADGNKEEDAEEEYDEMVDGVSLKGMLIQNFAMSRASSLTLSTLCKNLGNVRKGLEPARTEKEFVKVVNRILYLGMAPRGSGVFAKVDSSGKDDSGRHLEAQWFYVPECDEDQERAMLVQAMMPRPAKRSETKKPKQYYWRPLGKTSRWDPEDAL